MSLWFTASAVGPELRVLWGLSDGQVGWLTTTVQLGFVAGTGVVAVLNLADLLPARRLFASAAALGGGANLLLLWTPGYAGALIARFLTGFFLAGVYPPAMKMISTWFRSARGLAIGTVVGALTVGKASPYLLKALPSLSLDMVVAGASGAALLGSLLVLLGYREGPFPFARAPFSWDLVPRVLRHRPTRLAIGGYLGHMWELYAAWVSASLFFFAILGREWAADFAAFGMIAAGGIGAVLAGRWADLWGRERMTIIMMVISGSCALTIGWLGRWPVLAIAVGLVWGFTIVADSAQFSAVLTEVAPADAVGTGLTLQTCLGFALTGISIQLMTWIVDATSWGVAYSVLAIGPLLGIVSMVRLWRVRREGENAGI